MKNQIIILNLIFISLSIYHLHDDYQKKGKFQLVDQGDIADDEEFYLNVISLLIIIMGTSSISHQVLGEKINKRTFKFGSKLIENLFTILSGFYGIIILLLGLLVNFAVFAILGSQDFISLESIMMFVLIYWTFSLLGYLGFQILWQIFNIKRLKLKKRLIA